MCPTVTPREVNADCYLSIGNFIDNLPSKRSSLLLEWCHTCRMEALPVGAYGIWNTSFKTHLRVIHGKVMHGLDKNPQDRFFLCFTFTMHQRSRRTRPGGRDLFFGSVMITHSSPRRETVRGRGKERTFNYGNKPADHGACTASHLVDHLVHGQ